MPGGQAALVVAADVEHCLPGDPGPLGELLPRQLPLLSEPVEFGAQCGQVGWWRRLDCGVHTLWLRASPTTAQSNMLYRRPRKAATVPAVAAGGPRSHPSSDARNGGTTHAQPTPHRHQHRDTPTIVDRPDQRLQPIRPDRRATHRTPLRRHRCRRRSSRPAHRMLIQPHHTSRHRVRERHLAGHHPPAPGLLRHRDGAPTGPGDYDCDRLRRRNLDNDRRQTLGHGRLERSLVDQLRCRVDHRRRRRRRDSLRSAESDGRKHIGNPLVGVGIPLCARS